MQTKKFAGKEKKPFICIKFGFTLEKDADRSGPFKTLLYKIERFVRQF